MALPQPQAGSVALVTGASSGIGRELARGLARRGHGLVVVARRRERIEELANELSSAHGVSAEAIPADLTKPDERERLVDEIGQRGQVVDILVNNAGFGIYAPFAAAGVERELQQVELLVDAVVDLDARVVPGMRERRRGAILNVSSTAGFQALPGNGSYAAAKAYVLLHSEALHAELAPLGISVTASCPGPVHTEFQETSEPLFGDRMPKFVWRDPERVAEDSLRALERNKRVVVPGGPVVRAMFGPNRMAPPGLALMVSRRLMSRELSRGAAG